MFNLISKTFKFLSISLLLVIFLSFASNTHAYFKQEQFYDWGTVKVGREEILGLSVSAQDETGQVVQPSTEEAKLYTPNIQPGNPLYFGKRLVEQTQLLFTLDAKTRAKLRLNFAEKRLAEANALIEKGKIDSGLRTLSAYKRQMGNVSETISDLDKKNINISDLGGLLGRSTARHISALENVTPDIPNEKLVFIEEAISASQLGMDKAADILGEPAVPIDLLARLNSLRGQGIITQEETAAMLQAKTREEAREIFRRFVGQGIVPQADFKRFDSSQAKYYSSEFSDAVEMYKFKELVDMEKQIIDNATKDKIKKFAEGFQPGDIVPPELRPYWNRTVRLEEIQKTINLGKVDERFFERNNQVFDKFQELKDRVRPTADEARFAEEYIRNNPGKEIPPEILRISALRNKFGMLKPGEQPPAGHRESTYLPSEIFQFKEIPYQNIADKNQGGPGGFDYQTYLQGANFLPPPTSKPPSDIQKCPDGSTWNGWVCFFPPNRESKDQDFRQPYYPPQNQQRDINQRNYQPYQQESPGVYVAPQQQNFQLPQQPSQQPPPGTGGQQSPSCPSGSTWNGSTCHFPAGDSGQVNQPPPNNQPPPQEQQPPPDSSSQPPTN
jgi:hypothetical protein